jgi:PTH1 family peptidyl-tRNA hydrolase
MKFLIVGLGNKGAEYTETRHNIGFKIVDELAKEAGVSFETETLAYLARMKFKGKQLILIKPTTYMNLSGKAVNYWMQKEKIDKNNILVLLDDLHFDFGTVRLKPGGSDGGHNGLKDIQSVLNTTAYPRLRVGIGRPHQKGVQVDYVLGVWSEDEKKTLDSILTKSCDAIKKFVSLGLHLAMNEVNR